jgi:hypothetical protein
MNPETLALIERLNAATSAVGARITALLAEIDADALKPETRASFEQIATQLEAMGANPSNPLPNEPV